MLSSKSVKRSGSRCQSSPRTQRDTRDIARLIFPMTLIVCVPLLKVEFPSIPISGPTFLLHLVVQLASSTHRVIFPLSSPAPDTGSTPCFTLTDDQVRDTGAHSSHNIERDRSTLSRQLDGRAQTWCLVTDDTVKITSVLLCPHLTCARRRPTSLSSPQASAQVPPP